MSRRLPGATDSERLTLSTIKDSDQLTTRHNPGILDDVDLGTAKKILQATPVFACTSAAATAAKTAFLQDSFPDFELVNGRTIIVYMANANTAANPTLNVQYTDAIPLDGDYWQAGTFIKCQYVDITVNGNRIRRWVMDQGANNVKAQLNGALEEIEEKIISSFATRVENHSAYNFNISNYGALIIITSNAGLVGLAIASPYIQDVVLLYNSAPIYLYHSLYSYTVQIDNQSDGWAYMRVINL